MHFVGTAALDLPARRSWDLTYVASAVLIGAGFGSAALAVSQRVSGLRGRLLSTVLLTLGICGMHFTAMAALSFTPDPFIQIPEQAIQSERVAIGVIAVAVLIVVAGLIGSVVDQRHAHRAVIEAERLRQNVTELEATTEALRAIRRTPPRHRRKPARIPLSVPLRSQEGRSLQAHRLEQVRHRPPAPRAIERRRRADPRLRHGRGSGESRNHRDVGIPVQIGLGIHVPGRRFGWIMALGPGHRPADPRRERRRSVGWHRARPDGSNRDIGAKRQAAVEIAAGGKDAGHRHARRRRRPRAQQSAAADHHDDGARPDRLPEDSANVTQLHRVVDAGTKAAEIVQRILAFGRSDDVSQNLLDLGVVARDAISFIRTILPSSITLQVDIDDTVGRIRGDKTQLTQVLINLATNARDAIGANVGTVWVSLSKAIAGGRRAAFRGRNSWPREPTPFSRCATPAPAWTRRRLNESSSPSSPPRASARVPGSGFPSRTESSPVTAARSRSTARPAAARASRSILPIAEAAVPVALAG